MKKIRVLLCSLLPIGLLERYILKQFLVAAVLCLFAATAVFIVFEAFERMRIYVKYGASFVQILAYLMYKIPFIIHLMLPVAVLIATLLSIGRLSQLSEITAMRACGASVLSLARPIILASTLITALMYLSGETIVPWATQRGEDLYHIDIKKKDVSGTFSRSNFWYREDKTFYNIGFYDSSNATLQGISIFEVDDAFHIRKRTDAIEAKWSEHPLVRWTMNSAIETGITQDGTFSVERHKKLPLVIKETPKDFYNMRRAPETMSYKTLSRYVKKLKAEGVAVTGYLVDLAAKRSFPFVNIIVAIVAFPFALIPARSGNLSLSFLAGVSIGLGYYVVHAVCTSLGTAELIPVLPAAWSANILLGCIGGFLISGAEFK